MMNITLKQLKVFATVARNTNLSLAAEKLYLSKPAVSISLKELEKQLNRELFDRLPNSLRLNSNGEKLLPLADELLARAKLLDSLFDNAELTGEIKIGCSKAIGNHVLPELLAGFRQLTGHTNQRVEILNSEDVCRKLANFELDIGLIEADIPREGQVHLPWWQDRMCLIAATNHPLSQQASQSYGDLGGQDWILRELGSGSRDVFTQCLAPHLSQWNMTLELNDSEAIINAVSTGLGLACVSELTAKWALDDKRVKELPLDVVIAHPLFITYQEHKYKTPLFEAFFKYCQQYGELKMD
ncbi:LysR family transcriptional regulator [Shewanella psychropiezotolerans]|uniref:LysR family transcriptional regulator n=1 Tax=Shewanella psychropiezotolerans TaxID=2593655 RepID=A0ABX5WY34_9GAMM|nr:MULTISPECIES: LysR substrate-binding domain-containing protein [Shewanella]MPY22982.1 LysR family transcriptional regulator [Shewanella sp. YLB-07]QDO82648.1 LysR family transcriptional regulator [Shewanella psychropiezotolerans]